MREGEGEGGREGRGGREREGEGGEGKEDIYAQKMALTCKPHVFHMNMSQLPAYKVSLLSRGSLQLSLQLVYIHVGQLHTHSGQCPANHTIYTLYRTNARPHEAQEGHVWE